MAIIFEDQNLFLKLSFHIYFHEYLCLGKWLLLRGFLCVRIFRSRQTELRYKNKTRFGALVMAYSLCCSVTASPLFRKSGNHIFDLFHKVKDHCLAQVTTAAFVSGLLFSLFCFVLELPLWREKKRDSARGNPWEDRLASDSLTLSLTAQGRRLPTGSAGPKMCACPHTYRTCSPICTHHSS